MISRERYIKIMIKETSVMTKSKTFTFICFYIQLLFSKITNKLNLIKLMKIKLVFWKKLIKLLKK